MVVILKITGSITGSFKNKSEKHMNIFIDTISLDSKIIIFDQNREIRDTFTWKAKGNESSTLIPYLDDLIKKNKLSYSDLENIIIVNGPGSFTGVRTSVLVVNTLNYILKKGITSLSYFDLFTDYPIIKASSKRDCFVQMTQESDIEIIENQKLLERLQDQNISQANGESIPVFEGNVEIVDKIDYQVIIHNIKFDTKDQIDPLYIKRPNIS